MLPREPGRQKRIVPVTMERLGAKRERVHSMPADLDAGGIGSGVQTRAHPKARGGRRRGNELHDDFVGDEGLAPPVLADEREEAVFDLVPFAGAGREMTHGDRQPQFVRQEGLLGVGQFREAGSQCANLVPYLSNIIRVY